MEAFSAPPILGREPWFGFSLGLGALGKAGSVTGFSNREELFSGMQSQVPFFLEDRLVAQGARYEKPWLPFTAYAVTDGRIVTGQNPQSAKVVAEALLKRLAARP